MKITAVRAIPLAIPLRETPPLVSAWAGRASKQILVEVRTDAGLTGWGGRSRTARRSRSPT
jgi:L-alanine-DL-glutamate epimerase-like enolase superfamily enzyme